MVMDYGQFLHPAGPNALRMRQVLGLEEEEPEAGQCMLLSVAGSKLWRATGTSPGLWEVYALATTFRLELLEAALASPTGDDFRDRGPPPRMPVPPRRGVYEF